MRQPDLAAAYALVGQVSRIPAHQALTGPSAMCLACGADRTADPTQLCSVCGGPGATVSDVPPPSAQPTIGSLFSRRAGLRKKTAMLIALGTTGCNLLLHNGHTADVPFGDMPPPIEPDIDGAPVSALRSPIGRMLRYAAADDLTPLVEEWMAQAGVERLSDPTDGRYFDVLGGEGTELRVLRPAYRDVATSRPILMGQAERVAPQPVPAQAQGDWLDGDGHREEAR